MYIQNAESIADFARVEADFICAIVLKANGCFLLDVNPVLKLISDLD